VLAIGNIGIIVFVRHFQHIHWQYHSVMSASQTTGNAVSNTKAHLKQLAMPWAKVPVCWHFLVLANNICTGISKTGNANASTKASAHRQLNGPLTAAQFDHWLELNDDR